MPSMGRNVVQWNLTSMSLHNRQTNGEYLLPVITLQRGEDNWSNLTSGLSAEEVADLEDARANLEHYRKLYEIYEYSEDLNRQMNVLQTRIASQNPTLAFNIYRTSSSSHVDSLFPEVEAMLKAY